MQLFRPQYDVEDCIKEVRECLETGYTGYGHKTREFEDAWKQYTGHTNAFFVNSGTAGLNLVVETLKEVYDWEDEDEVITTPLTCVTTNHSILRAGLKPIFVDVDDSLCIDPIEVKKHISKRTKAIMFCWARWECWKIQGNSKHM